MEDSGALTCQVKEEINDGVIRGFKSRKIIISKLNQSTITYKDIKYSKAVLYIHGFADCFYNSTLAKKYSEKGYAFYGLDLRGYGRSIVDESSKFYVESLDDYFKEIDSAIYLMLQRHNVIILQGFSMGGLISSIYMKRGFYRNHIAALVLISPLFKFSTNTFQNYFLKPVILGVAKLFPFIKYNVNTARYKNYLTRISMDDIYSAEEIDHDKVHNKNIPIYLGWLKAVNDSTEELSKGLGIKKPVLVLSSDKSCKDIKKYERNSDVILDVKDIEIRSKSIGDDVTYIPIKDAIHDIFFSKKDVADECYSLLFDWLNING